MNSGKSTNSNDTKKRVTELFIVDFFSSLLLLLLLLFFLLCKINILSIFEMDDFSKRLLNREVLKLLIELNYWSEMERTCHTLLSLN